jgi:YidC/Oxa1 family membrane protein insertase
MEQRLVLAFALSFLVLVIWSYMYAPRQEPGVPEGADIQEEKKEEIPPVAARSPVIDLPVFQDNGEPITEAQGRTLVIEKEILVETPLYQAIFSNKGASIKSFELKNYRITIDPESLPVQLVNLENDSRDAFFIGFSEDMVSGDEKVFYSISEESLVLIPDSEPRDLTFKVLRSDGIGIDQTFRFYADRYDIDIFLKITNHSDLLRDGSIMVYLKNLPPEDKSSYYAFSGIAVLLANELEEIKPKKLKEDKYLSGRIEWMAYENGYFISAIIPEDQERGDFRGSLLPSGIVKAVYAAPATSLQPYESISSRFTLYMGPRDMGILEETGHNLEEAINFGFFDIIAKPLHFILLYFNKFVHNYGVSIILLTVLIKILFWPLTHKSYKSMKEMQKLQPLMAKIREKYKDDKQQMQRELMGLYKTYKVNPLGGCLPILIQIPVFFALFRILGNSIELRHAPFILWITDLSAPDRLFDFPFKIPFMSPPYGIPVLTLLMGASMFIQQKMQPAPGDPSQAKVMMFLPVIFTIMFINFPSGLVLYWLTNNILSIGQQYRIKKGST